MKTLYFLTAVVTLCVLPNLSAALPLTPDSAVYEIAFVFPPSGLSCGALNVSDCLELSAVALGSRANVTKRFSFPANEPNFRRVQSSLASMSSPGAQFPPFPEEIVITLRPSDTTTAGSNPVLPFGFPFIGIRSSFATPEFRAGWALWMQEIAHHPNGSFPPKYANASVRAAASTGHGIFVNGYVHVPRLILYDVSDESGAQTEANIRAAVLELAAHNVTMFISPPKSGLTEVAALAASEAGVMMVGTTASSLSLFQCMDLADSNCERKTLGMRRFQRFLGMSYPADAASGSRVSAVVSASTSAIGGSAKSIVLIIEDNTFGKNCADGVRTTASAMGLSIELELVLPPEPSTVLTTAAFREALAWRSPNASNASPGSASSSAADRAARGADIFSLCTNSKDICPTALNLIASDQIAPQSLGIPAGCVSDEVKLVSSGTVNATSFEYLFGAANWHRDARGSSFVSSPDSTIPLWTPSSPSQTSAEVFGARFDADFGANPGDFEARAVAALVALQHALTTVSTTDLDEVELALFALDEPSFFGKIAFRKNGMRDGEPLVTQFAQGVSRVVAPLLSASTQAIFPAPPMIVRPCLRHDPPFCGANGECSWSTGRCICASGWMGERCHEKDPGFQFPWWGYLLLVLGVTACCVTFGVLFKRWRDSQKQYANLFSAQSLAEKTAEAIVEMRLEDLDYLKEAGEGDRLTGAFLRIIANLRAYRPFIPQHLLARKSQDADTETDDERSGMRSGSARVRGLARRSQASRTSRGSSKSRDKSQGSAATAQHAGAHNRFHSLGLHALRATVVSVTAGGLPGHGCVDADTDRPFSRVPSMLPSKKDGSLTDHDITKKPISVLPPIRKASRRGAQPSATSPSREGPEYVMSGAAPGEVVTVADRASFLVNLCETAARNTNGTLTISPSGHVFVVYLAGTCARREQRATEFAALVLAAAAGPAHRYLGVSVGIVSATERCGNVGSDRTRAFVLGGGSIDRAIAFARLARASGVGCLMDEETAGPLMRVHVVARAAIVRTPVVGVGKVTAPFLRRPGMELGADLSAADVLSAARHYKTNSINVPIGPSAGAAAALGVSVVFELVAVDQRHGHEWMYELEGDGASLSVAANRALTEYFRAAAVSCIYTAVASHCPPDNTPRPGPPLQESSSAAAACRAAAESVYVLPATIDAAESQYDLTWAHAMAAGQPPPPFVTFDVTLAMTPLYASALFGSSRGDSLHNVVPSPGRGGSVGVRSIVSGGVYGCSDADELVAASVESVTE
eukprot:TRINITY_DN1010_c0_g1_i4.p1 TRINITY_DN1010_c0_g1~~TRINITY_DN1010_c0_g1_i4.p1  ORF type:complete len:1266 (+),score=266.40 TRINITY_DN1010_c0_g1_i4:106-3903(+)